MLEFYQTQSKKSAFSSKNQFSQLSSTIQMLSACIWVIRWKKSVTHRCLALKCRTKDDEKRSTKGLKIVRIMSEKERQARETKVLESATIIWASL